MITGRRREPLDAVSSHTGATVVQGDVADPAVTEAVGAAVEQHGALDIVVNNAGIGGPGWHEVLEVNLGGARLVCETALPHLVERRGSIVNVSSVSAFHAHRRRRVH